MTNSSTSSSPIVACRDVDVTYLSSTQKIQSFKELVISKLKGQFHLEKFQALKSVTVDAFPGECLALVGHNGCGKSTLLKVIAGIIKPTKGTAKVGARIAPLIELGAGFDPELTGEENVYLSCSLMGLSRQEITAKLPQIRDFSELSEFFDKPVKTYSSGMYMRLGFSCAIAVDADIILIDEILAVGDENFQKKCNSEILRLRQEKKTIILVTHDLGAVTDMADRCYVIDRGEVYYEGDPEEAVMRYTTLMRKRYLEKLGTDAEQEGERVEKLMANSDSLGKKGVAIIRMEAIQAGNKKIDPNQEVEIAIDLAIEQNRAKDVIVGFGILNRKGHRITGGNTKILRDKVSGDPALSTGVHTVRFRMSRLPLASGPYTLVVGAHNTTMDETLDIRTVADAFQVIDTDDLKNFDEDILEVTKLMDRVVIEPRV